MSSPWDQETDLQDLQDLSDAQLLAVIADARESERLPTTTEIKKLLAVMAVAYPPPKISIETARQRVDLYCRMLADIPARELSRKV